MTNLIGQEVRITNKESRDFGNWGIVKLFDGQDYHVAMNGDGNAQLAFSRSEFRIPKNQPADLP